MHSYSPSARGFFHTALHLADAVPADAVPISAERWRALLAAQAAGQVIEPDASGHPVAVAPPPPPVVPLRVIGALAFRRRLPVATRTAITLAASTAMEAGDARLQVFLDDLAASQRVELDDPEVVAGVALLLDAGLIDAAQRDALLADVTG